MKKKLILILSIIPLFACENNEDQGDIYQYDFYPDSKISITKEHEIENVKIVSGNNIVFKYFFTADDDPRIADDEFSDQIIFEINPNLDSFVINDEDFTISNSIYGKFCFCGSAGHHPITSGEIKGNKINDYEWQIDIDITIKTEHEDITKKISAIFQHHSFRHLI